MFSYSAIEPIAIYVFDANYYVCDSVLVVIIHLIICSYSYSAFKLLRCILSSLAIRGKCFVFLQFGARNIVSDMNLAVT